MLKALIPEAEIGDLIVELRSATSGVGPSAHRSIISRSCSGKPAEAVMRKSQGASMFRRVRVNWAGWRRCASSLHSSLSSRAERSADPGSSSSPRQPGIPALRFAAAGMTEGGVGVMGGKGRCGRANGGTRPGPPCGPDKKVAGHRFRYPAKLELFRIETRKPSRGERSNVASTPGGDGGDHDRNHVYMRDGNPACNAYDVITAMRCCE